MPEIEVDGSMILKMLIGFFGLGISSIVLGLIFGLLTSFILKVTPKVN